MPVKKKDKRQKNHILYLDDKRVICSCLRLNISVFNEMTTVKDIRSQCVKSWPLYIYKKDLFIITQIEVI